MYILTQDNDCHWYVIPESMMDDWSTWLERDADEENTFEDVPDYATAVGGSPTLVVFPSFEIR
jgi:hypothetical protein